MMLCYIVVLTLLSLCLATTEEEVEVDLTPFQCDDSQIGKTRLVNDLIEGSDVNSTAMVGRAEVCWPTPSDYNMTIPLWGTICSTDFGANDGDAVCASLYYFSEAGQGSVYRIKETLTTWNSAPDAQPVWLEQVGCGTGTEDNLTQCTYANQTNHNGTLEATNDCQHAQDVYIYCNTRIRCNYCDKQSCNYEVLDKRVDLCSKDEVYCTRQVKTYTNGTVAKYMGCSEDPCADWRSETCVTDPALASCLCNDCDFDNCNLLFLRLYETNLAVIGDRFYSFLEFLQQQMNTAVRLFLLDFSAYMGLI